MILVSMAVSSCSAPDNPAEGFEELTGITLHDDATIIDYQFDEKMGWSYLGTIESKDTNWLAEVKNRLEKKDSGWECQYVIYSDDNKKFYRQYFDIDTSAIESAPVVFTCKKDSKNGRNGRVKICENRLYFQYFEVLDP